MNHGPCWWFGFALGVLAGGVLRLLTAHRRTVVRYNAVDVEHGPVRVVVTSNRFTGRLTRRVYKRDVSKE